MRQLLFETMPLFIHIGLCSLGLLHGKCSNGLNPCVKWVRERILKVNNNAAKNGRISK